MTEPKPAPALVFEIVDLPRRSVKPRRTPRKSRAGQYKPTPKTMRLYECVNCGLIFPWHRDRAYCTTWCTAIADTIRYQRSVERRYPGGPPEEVKEAIRTRMGQALSSGYDKGGRQLSKERRAEVWARDESRCVDCGAEGAEIDHISGSSSDLSNLRLLCVPCHKAYTRAHVQPIADDDVETWALVREIQVRVFSPEPLRECDAEEWSERDAWRRWARAHMVSMPT